MGKHPWNTGGGGRVFPHPGNARKSGSISFLIVTCPPMYHSLPHNELVLRRGTIEAKGELLEVSLGTVGSRYARPPAR